MQRIPGFLVMDAGSPVAAFTARRELKTYLERRLDMFINRMGTRLITKARRPS
jgi:hypothetical protein